MSSKLHKSKNKNITIGMIVLAITAIAVLTGYFFVMTNGKIRLEGYSTDTGCLAALNPKCGYCPDDGVVIFGSCYVPVPKDKLMLKTYNHNDGEGITCTAYSPECGVCPEGGEVINKECYVDKKTLELYE